MGWFGAHLIYGAGAGGGRVVVGGRGGGGGGVGVTDRLVRLPGVLGSNKCFQMM